MEEKSKWEIGVEAFSKIIKEYPSVTKYTKITCLRECCDGEEPKAVILPDKNPHHDFDKVALLIIMNCLNNYDISYSVKVQGDYPIIVFE